MLFNSAVLRPVRLNVEAASVGAVDEPDDEQRSFFDVSDCAMNMESRAFGLFCVDVVDMLFVQLVVCEVKCGKLFAQLVVCEV